MRLRRAIDWRCLWQSILLVVGLRVGLGIVAVAGFWAFPDILRTPGPPYDQLLIPRDAGGWPFIGVWQRWDAVEYQWLATAGYHFGDRQAVFLPLYPGLVHAVGWLTGGSYAVAGLIVSSVSLVGALYLLRRLLEADFGGKVADRALTYLTIAPSAFFLVAGYTESLFLLLAVASFRAARQKRFVAAGLLATLGTVCRLQGVLLVAPLAVEACMAMVARRRRGNFLLSPAYAALLSPLAALAAWDTYVDRHLFPGGISAVAHAWGHRTVPFGLPLGEAARLAAQHPNWNAAIPLDLSAVTLLLLTTLYAVRRLPWSYVALGAVSVVPLMVDEIPGAPLGSAGRYMIVVFPLFVSLAILGLRRDWLDRMIMAVSPPLLGITTLYFTHYGFVG